MPASAAAVRLPSATTQLPALDGVRALAVIGVFAQHLFLLPGGFVGVQIFFVLSGFLITSLLCDERERTGSIGLRSFYIRRAARLFPAMVISIAAILLVTIVQFDKSVDSVVFYGVGALFYVSNVVSTLKNEVTPGPDYCWSLAEEEQFYLAVPLIIRRLDPRNYRLAATVCLWLAATTAIVREAVLRLAPGWTMSTYHNPLLNFDCLLIGMAIAMVLRTGATRLAWLASRMWVGALAIAGLVAASHFGNPRAGRLGWTDMAADVSAGLLIAHLATSGGFGRLFELPLLRWIGNRSYAIYLYQIPVIFFVGKVITDHDSHPSLFVARSIAVLSTVIVAAMSTSLIENPIRRAVRKRLGRAPRAAPTRTATAH